jgi:hypothetical protein
VIDEPELDDDDDYLTETQFRALDLGSLTPEQVADAIDRYETGLRVAAERQAEWEAEHAGEVWFGHVIGGDDDEVVEPPAEEPEVVDDESQYELDPYLDLWPWEASGTTTTTRSPSPSPTSSPTPSPGCAPEAVGSSPPRRSGGSVRRRSSVEQSPDLR